MSLAQLLAKHMTKTVLTTGGFSQKTMSHLKLLEAQPGTVKFFV